MEQFHQLTTALIASLSVILVLISMRLMFRSDRAPRWTDSDTLAQGSALAGTIGIAVSTFYLGHTLTAFTGVWPAVFGALGYVAAVLAIGHQSLIGTGAATAQRGNTSRAIEA